MATQKKGRTSKTSHVLSLLSGAGVPTEPQTEEKQPTEQPQEQQAEKTETKEAVPQKRKRAPSKSKENPASAKETPDEMEEPVQESETESIPESMQEVAPSEPVAEPVPRRTLTPPIVEVARTNNEMLAETIKNALNDALEQEIAQQQQEEAARQQHLLEREEALEEKQTPAPHEEQMEEQTEQSSSIEPEEVPQEPETIPPREQEILPPDWEPSPVMQQEPLPQEEQAESIAQPEVSQPEQPQEVQEPGRLPDGAIFINVMELLVEEKMERYVKMFGLCACPRCLADIKALALSRLKAKYVVLEEHARVPMLSFYEAKYDELVIPEVIHACKTVMEHPRHKI